MPKFGKKGKTASTSLGEKTLTEITHKTLKRLSTSGASGVCKHCGGSGVAYFIESHIDEGFVRLGVWCIENECGYSAETGALEYFKEYHGLTPEQ